MNVCDCKSCESILVIVMMKSFQSLGIKFNILMSNLIS